jgi:hypothetical protein
VQNETGFWLIVVLELVLAMHPQITDNGWIWKIARCYASWITKDKVLPENFDTAEIREIWRAFLLLDTGACIVLDPHSL